MRAGVSGFVYDFLVYTSMSTFAGAIPDKEHGLGRKVLELCRPVRNASDCVVHFDNSVTSLKLITQFPRIHGH